MNSGATLTLYVGPFLAEPAPAVLSQNLEQATVTINDTGRSGFQLTFVVGRDRKSSLEGFDPLLRDLVKIGNRVQLVGTVRATPHVLMDGIITQQQLSPSAEPGASRLTVTGEDLAVLLDLVEVQFPAPAMPEWAIATALIATLAPYGVVPQVIPSPFDQPSSPTDEVPQKNGTALSILNSMAENWGFVFYVAAGPTRGTSAGYWGPPIRAGLPQRALTAGMGGETNLSGIQFTSDGTRPHFVVGLVQERNSNVPIPIAGLPYAGQPMAALPSFLGNLPFVGSRLLDDDQGGSVIRALARATSQMYDSIKDSVTATGDLDTGRYGTVLRARELVDVRGVGVTHDGTWFVKSVTHTLARGSWKQSFNLAREGTGALSNTVGMT